MEKIIRFFIIINFVFYTNCASSQLKYKEDIYTILNIKIDRLSEKKIDTLFVRKKTVNSHFKEIIKQKELIPKIDNYELIKVLSNKKEINHLISQLKDTFLINFKKIKSNKIKEYIKPIEKKNERGYYVQTKESIADFSKIKYTFSKPIFSVDGKYSMMIVSKDGSYISVAIFNKKNNKWSFLENVLLGIV